MVASTSSPQTAPVVESLSATAKARMSGSMTAPSTRKPPFVGRTTSTPEVRASSTKVPAASASPRNAPIARRVTSIPNVRVSGTRLRSDLELKGVFASSIVPALPAENTAENQVARPKFAEVRLSKSRVQLARAPVLTPQARTRNGTKQETTAMAMTCMRITPNVQTQPTLTLETVLRCNVKKQSSEEASDMNSTVATIADLSEELPAELVVEELEDRREADEKAIEDADAKKAMPEDQTKCKSKLSCLNEARLLRRKKETLVEDGVWARQAEELIAYVSGEEAVATQSCTDLQLESKMAAEELAPDTASTKPHRTISCTQGCFVLFRPYRALGQ